jgi:hypothetical protein
VLQRLITVAQEQSLNSLQVVIKLHGLRPREDSTALTPRLHVSSTAFLALLRCKFRDVFTHLGSAVLVATMYDFVVTLKHANC